MFVKKRRCTHGSAAHTSELHGRSDRSRATVRGLDGNDEPQVFDLQIVDDLIDGIYRGIRNVVASQSIGPISKVVLRKPLIERHIQRLIVRDSRLTSTEALVSRQFRRLQRIDQSLPKFLQR